MNFRYFFTASCGALFILGLSSSGLHAQSLNLHSGDNVTVDASGTHGTINKHPVSNNVTSYISVGKDATGVDNDAVQVHGTAVFTLASGGTITGGINGYALESFDTSKVNITGGTIVSKMSPTPKTTASMGTPLHANDNSKVIISGGSLTASGNLGSVVAVDDTASVIVSGGVLTAHYAFVLAPEGQGTVTLIGGTITATNNQVGVAAGGMDGTISIFSKGPLTVSGVSMSKGSLAANAVGEISGTLLDGSSLDTNFMNGGHINVNIGKAPTVPSTQTAKAAH